MKRIIRVGRAPANGLEEARLRRGTRDGRLGDGGGEYKRRLRGSCVDDEEAESRPWARSRRLYEAALRRFIRGGTTSNLWLETSN